MAHLQKASHGPDRVVRPLSLFLSPYSCLELLRTGMFLLLRVKITISSGILSEVVMQWPPGSCLDLKKSKQRKDRIERLMDKMEPRIYQKFASIGH